MKYFPMSDVWDEDGEDPTELTQVERQHNNAGYLDGITAAKEATHQSGFDDGYIYGAEIGLESGKIIGTLQGLGLHELESQAVRELSPARLFNYEYFYDDTKPKFSGKHPVLIKWEAKLSELST